MVNPGGWFLSPFFSCAFVPSCAPSLKLSPNSVNCLQAISWRWACEAIPENVGLCLRMQAIPLKWACEDNFMEGGLLKTTLDTVSLHVRMQPLHGGGSVRQSLELSLKSAHCFQAILVEGGPVKTIFEIVGLRWSMQAILMEGGLAKTIFEIVSELGQLLASHSHRRWACEDHS